MKVFLSDIDSLYDRYSGRLFHTSLRIVGDRTEAEQIMHDTLLKWLRRSPAGPVPGATPDSASDGRIEAWLVKVCVRASIDAIRRRRTLRRLFPERSLAERISDEAETEAGWSGLLGDSRSEATEKVERIRRGMSRLPAGYRAVLSLLLFEGYDYEEAAEITGLKASSVRSQDVRAKARLLEILKRMDNLREFVKKNRAAFDTEPLDEGHRGRFAAKLARGTERGASVLLRRFWAAGCAAAVVLGLLWLRTGHSQGDPVRRVIAAYKRDMDSLNREITAFCLRTGADTSQINRTIRIIDCEAVPLYEQLPDELDDAEKVRILRRYFGLKVNAVKQLRAQIADEQ